jgi:hypothetical protein
MEFPNSAIRASANDTILRASNQLIGGMTLVPVWKDPEF